MNYPYLLFFAFIFVVSCSGQIQPAQGLPEAKDKDIVAPNIPGAPMKIYGPLPDPYLDGQISEYVRRIFQDKNGDLWFGTNSNGVCRYNGKSLTYFTTTEGFSGNAVRGMVADESGNIWFATNGGVCRYDISRANQPCNNNTCTHDLNTDQGIKEHSQELARSFTKYTQSDGLSHDQVWSIMMDNLGNFWFGTEGGVSCLNVPLQLFTNFPLPSIAPEVYPNEAYPAPKLVNAIIQDKAGNMWFGSNGGGVYRYDGMSLNNIAEKDGLCNNFVQCILEDKSGALWFGTRFGGLSRYDPAEGKFTNFTVKEGLTTDFIWTLLEDNSVPAGEIGIWISAVAGGLCRFDSGKGGVSKFAETEGLTSRHVQSIFRDKNGVIWLGCSGGLFRRKTQQGGFFNVLRNGPWEE